MLHWAHAQIKEEKPLMKRTVSLLLLVVLTMALLLSSAMAISTMYVYTENGKSLNVRSSPSTGNNLIGSLKYGQQVGVERFLDNGWCAIVWGSYGTAYVQSRYLQWYVPGPKPTVKPTAKPTAAPSTDKAKVLDAINAEFKSAKKVNTPFTVVARPARASGFVNLRWAPSAETTRITTCTQGKELTVLAETKKWYQVQDPATGMIGFISKSYVTRK